jgi:ubiquinone/menaquinone biosynthesis C-methylase UbiE
MAWSRQRCHTRGRRRGTRLAVAAPDYLTKYYWWAYVEPRAVRIFERRWLVNAILWGNYARLRDAALADLGEVIPGNTLQLACVYGNLTEALSARVRAAGGSLDVIDVLPIQLANLRRKLPADAPARTLRMDSANLYLPDASYDSALLFFLLHEQPQLHRQRTLAEAFRVVKPGGKIVIVDYARPCWWHPLRYLMRPLLKLLEPFALDLWRAEIMHSLPAALHKGSRKQCFFGGLYQKVTVMR